MSLSVVHLPTPEEPDAAVRLLADREHPPAVGEGQDRRCRAEWRRPQGHWSCVRGAGHRGRHRMRSANNAA